MMNYKYYLENSNHPLFLQDQPDVDLPPPPHRPCFIHLTFARAIIIMILLLTDIIINITCMYILVAHQSVSVVGIHLLHTIVFRKVNILEI